MLGQPEFAINNEPRCPVVLLLDNSASMSGEPIEELNRGLITFKESLQQDTLASLRVDLSIVSFGGHVEHVQDFVTVDDYQPKPLGAKGLTPMGAAIEYGLDSIKNRKKTYDNNGIQYYRPWMILITDGAPTDSWENAGERIRQAEVNKDVIFFKVGVSGADMEILNKISFRPPAMLNGLDFSKFFVWLSTSMKTVSSTKPNSNEMVALTELGWSVVGV
jgi:uncharacterized protein YegL